MEHPFLLLNWLLDKVHVYFFTNVLYSWLIILLLVVAGKMAVGTVKMVPSGGQNLFEVILGGFEDFMLDVMGHEGKPFFPMIATLFVYILVMNWIGLIPGMGSPTADINTPLSMALVVFLITHLVGIKTHGPKYIKHFMGPVWWLSPLIFIIEVISHFSRIMSLTFRLFGNVLGEDLVLAILILLAGAYFAPLPMMFLAIFTSFVQAFIFSLLTMLYIAGALEHAH
ncbi:ATP synthase subunit a [Desulfarculales bacterium]